MPECKLYFEHVCQTNGGCGRAVRRHDLSPVGHSYWSFQVLIIVSVGTVLGLSDVSNTGVAVSIRAVLRYMLFFFGCRAVRLSTDGIIAAYWPVITPTWQWSVRDKYLCICVHFSLFVIFFPGGRVFRTLPYRHLYSVYPCLGRGLAVCGSPISGIVCKGIISSEVNYQSQQVKGFEPWVLKQKEDVKISHARQLDWYKRRFH